MKKIFSCLFAGVVCSIFIAGCSTFDDPEYAGKLAGRSAYLIYERVAESKGSEFKGQVADIWTEVNKIDSVEDLTKASSILKPKFEATLKNQGLTDSETMLLQIAFQGIFDKIDAVTASTFEPNENGIKFLIGVRDGVNSMIKLKK